MIFLTAWSWYFLWGMLIFSYLDDNFSLTIQVGIIQVPNCFISCLVFFIFDVAITELSFQLDVNYCSKLIEYLVNINTGLLFNSFYPELYTTLSLRFQMTFIFFLPSSRRLRCLFPFWTPAIRSTWTRFWTLCSTFLVAFF